MKLSFFAIITLTLISFSSLAQQVNLKNEKPYNLESIFIGGQKNTISKDKATILFYTKTKTAKCFTSCNFVDLKYSAKKNKFKFTSVKPGDVPCPDHLLGLELDLKENFPKVTDYQLINNKIYFFNKKDTLMVFYE
jgi:heat shock protein HslJ